MVWRQIIPLILLSILYGVCCNGIFEPKCSEETCQCGETVTVTCDLNHPLEEITLSRNGTSLLSLKLPTKEGIEDKNNQIIEWTEDKVKVTISKVKFSNRLSFNLLLEAKDSKGTKNELITIKVTGLCEPEMSKNNKTKELECVAESEQNTEIVWMDKQRKSYMATRTREPEILNTGYRLWSSLKLTEEIGDDICCVSYRIDGIYTEKSSCVPNTSAIGGGEPLISKNPTLSVVLILLAVALVAAAFGYLLKKRDRTNFRARSLSEGPLMDEEPTTKTV